MDKWLSRINKNSFKIRGLNGDDVDSIGSDLTSSTMSPHDRGIYRKKAELRKLIIQVSKNYGGDDEKFLEEYINDILSKDIEKALTCFRDLINQVSSVNNRK